jgi:hypothetical protein
LIPPQVSGTSLPDSGGILLGGNAADRSITIKPAPNRFGTTTVRLTVTDTGKSGGAAPILSTTKNISVTVGAVPQTPQIVSIVPGTLATAVNTESDIAQVTLFDQESQQNPGS